MYGRPKITAVEVDAALAHHHRAEHQRFLPGLRTEGERHDPLGLDLVGDGEELVPGLRRGDADIGEDLGRIPEPVAAADVDRDGVELAIDARLFGDEGGKVLLPVLVGQDVVQRGEHALVDQGLDLAEVGDHRGRCVAAGKTAEDGSAQRLIARDRTVLPGAAGLLEGGYDLLHRGRFAAARPIVHDVGGLRRRGSAPGHRRHQGQRRHHSSKLHHDFPFP
jgi:hypothetical protein